MNDFSMTFDGEKNEKAIVKLTHGVGQTALAHLLHTFYRASHRGGGSFQSRNKFVLVLFRHVRTDNKHQFISTIHHLSQLAASSFRG